MKKYGFLFGAGAEIVYNLPNGGKFALDIFRRDTNKAKELFKEMRQNVNDKTSYASNWLPKDYLSKNISTYNKAVFENIIVSTIEHNRMRIIDKINSFDDIAYKIINSFNQTDIIDNAFSKLLEQKVQNINMSQVLSYNENLKIGDKLFESNYFSALLSVYKKFTDKKKKVVLRNVLISIMQLQLGALTEDLSRNINDNLFKKKDDDSDLFDEFGDLVQINYNLAGVSGLELLLDMQEFENEEPCDVVLNFALRVLENIYASVLDYKNLIDSNWSYLYCPHSEWTKFCKISIFLLTVYEYIEELSSKAETDIDYGYYNVLKEALDNKRIDVTTIGTTNYSRLIERILGIENITYLNGSTSLWYDPYLNKIGSKKELQDDEHHIILPLLFTQSGTKPMTSIRMSEKYVDLYRQWKGSDAIVVVGFGFNLDDEHINGMLRTLVNEDGKEIYIVRLSQSRQDDKVENERIKKELSAQLKISDNSKLNIILVNEKGQCGGKNWMDIILNQ